jgi:hypothetical protein
MGAWSTPTRAATFTVTNGDTAGLKSAITAANAAGDADTINLASGGTYTLSTVDNSTNGPNGLPVIVHDLTINGNGATLQRSAGAAPIFRLLQVGPGATVSITGLTVLNGQANVASDAFQDNCGGGITSLGTLTLTNCTFRNNSAVGTDQYENGYGGGAVFSTGILNVAGCTFSDNRGGDGGAICSWGETDDSGLPPGSIYPTAGIAALTISDSTFSGNDADDGGGAIFSNGWDGHATFSATNCVFSENTALFGGVLYSDGGQAGSVVSTLTNCTFSDNAATVAGGAMAFSNFDADGDAAPGSASLTLNHCLLTGNSVLESGDDEDFEAGGGAIYALGGTLSITDSTLSGNSSPEGGGGGIRVNGEDSSANTTITGSTLSGNSATVAGAIYNDGWGGSATMTISNSTISGNSATGEGGGGIINDGGGHGNGSLTIASCTIAGNTANLGGGIVTAATDGGGTSAVTLSNTILQAGSAGANLTKYQGGGTFTSQGYNLCSDNGAGALTAATDHINTDAKLGSLSDNSGPTQTMALLAGSPAIDAGATDLTVDQRGVPRPQGSADDIGAFESAVVDTTAPVSVSITTPANGATVSSLSTISGSASDNAGGSGIKSVSLVLHRIVSGAAQYWNGSAWVTTPAYLYPTLNHPGAVDTDWSLASNKLPSGSNLPAGTYYLRAWAYDQGSHSVFSGQQSFKVVVDDQTAPVNVTITTPANGASVSTLSSIAGSASDNAGGSGIKSVSLVLHRIVSGSAQYWNGSAWSATASYLYPTLSSPNAVNTNWSLAVDKLPSGANLPAGTYYLRAWAYDQANLSVFSGQQYFKVVVNDPTAPVSVTIATPVNGSTVGSLPSISGSASDNAGGSGIKSVSVVLHRIVSGAAQYWNGSAWVTTASYLYPTLNSPGAVTTSWSLASNKLPSGSNLPVGTYYLRAWAYDQGNLSVFSGQQSFKVADTTAPVSVTITTPANGSTVSGLSAISGSASDNAGGSGIKSVSVVLHRIVSGAAQYWNGSAWVTTASYLYPTLGDPGAVNTDWSLAANKLPSGSNLPAGTYYLRAWAYDQGNLSVYSGLQSFSVGAEGLSATPSSVKLQDVSGVVSSSRIVLTFGSGLQPAEANDASHYAVTVGGVRASVLSASYASSTHRVTLQLKDGALRGGEIVIGYRNLRDAEGSALEQAAYAVDAE